MYSIYIICSIVAFYLKILFYLQHCFLLFAVGSHLYVAEFLVFCSLFLVCTLFRFVAYQLYSDRDTKNKNFIYIKLQVL